MMTYDIFGLVMMTYDILTVSITTMTSISIDQIVHNFQNVNDPMGVMGVIIDTLISISRP